jgi:hypothetical protein
MQTQYKVALKTMAIKARLANKIRTTLYDKGVYTSPKIPLTDSDKIAFFDSILVDARKMHWELKVYKMKRQAAAKIEAIRAAKGNRKKKNKTTYAQYLASQESVAV